MRIIQGQAVSKTVFYSTGGCTCLVFNEYDNYLRFNDGSQTFLSKSLNIVPIKNSISIGMRKSYETS